MKNDHDLYPPDNSLFSSSWSSSSSLWTDTPVIANHLRDKDGVQEENYQDVRLGIVRIRMKMILMNIWMVG